jgi:hypothetical protein
MTATAMSSHNFYIIHGGTPLGQRRLLISRNERIG